MQNNNPNDYLQEDEIDLKEIFKLLINSKKLIIAITLLITTLGAIYAFQKAPEYKSTALIEIGKYYQDQDEQILIEPAKNLVQDLTINFNYKQQVGVSIDSFENRLINITLTSSSSVKNKNLLNEIVRYIKNRHSLLQSNNTQKTENKLTNKIKSLNDQIEYINNTLLTQNEDEILRISNQIETLNNELPSLDSKIESLNEVIVADQDNLLLLKSNPEFLIQRAAQSPSLEKDIFSYNNKLIDYKNKKINLALEKDNLEIQLKFLESDHPESEKVFKLSQEKDSLELELEYLALAQQNETSTQLIREIETTAIESKKGLTILLSFMFGLFLSILIVFINKSLKAFKEQLV
jgi:hypothetical protein